MGVLMMAIMIYGDGDYNEVNGGDDTIMMMIM